MLNQAISRACDVWLPDCGGPAEQREVSAEITNRPFTHTMKGNRKIESLSSALHKINTIIHSLSR